MFATSVTWGAPQRLTYQGRIVATDGTPLEYNDTSFRFQITSSDGTCILYYEQRDHVNLQNSNGIFDISIGDGTVTYAVGGANKLSDSFINGVTYACYGSGNWLATSTSERLLKVSFNDGNGWKEITPANVIRSVPFAMSAYSAQTIADKTINDIVLKSTLPAACIAGQVLTWNGSAFVCTADATGVGTITGVTAGSGLTGGGTTGAVSLALTTTGVSAGTYGSATQIPTFAVDAQGRISSVTPVTITGTTPGGSASGDLTGTYPGPTITTGAVTSAKILDGTIVGADMDFTGTNTATTNLVMKDSSGKFTNFACATAGHVATWTVAGWACQAPATTGLPLSGGTMAGDIDMNGNNITNIGYMTMLPSKSLHLSNNASDPTGLTNADKGKVWFNSTSNEVKYWNGSSAVAVGSTGAAVTSLTGDVTGSGPGATATTIAVGAVTSSKILDGTIVAADMDFTGVASSSAGIVMKDASGKFISATCSSAGDVATWTASGWACQAPADLPWSKITSGTPTTLSGYGITDAVKNGGGTPSITTGTSGAKPATGASGAIYIETDTQYVYSGTGSGWLTIGGSPAGVTALTGDVTASGTGSVAATIANSAVTNAKMANMAAYTLKGNNTGSSAVPTDVTITSLQGTTASTFAAGNDSRITGALQSGAAAGGDLTGTYPNPTIAANAITTGKIASSTILGTNMNFTGVNAGTTNMVLKDATGKFFDFGCSTAGHVATWTVAGWACQAVTVTTSSFGSQTQNTFLAAPNGSDGNPTFRTIASADLPLTGASGAYINGGNSFGSAATIGTNDANSFAFKTAGNTRVTINASGQMGLGAAPSTTSLFEVAKQSSGYGMTISAPAAGWIANDWRIGGVQKAVMGVSNGGTFFGSSSDAANDFVIETSSSNLIFATGSSENMRLSTSGTLGIGTIAPSANTKLHVVGTIVATPNSIASGAAVNLASSNTSVLASVGGTSITLSNMVHGGNYTLVIQDTTSRTYTFSGCNTSKFLPPNGPTVSGSWSTYNILTLYNGATYDCVITWATGYQ
ncbi:MAG: hypothetical protein J7501_02970 [Bdellovibrio sp.]|nr:hypothetical protein [Bdellovibrio sp.]